MTALYIGLAIVLDGGAALVAGLIPEGALVTARQPLIAFAAGVLLGTTFFDLLPEALVRSGGRAGLIVRAGGAGGGGPGPVAVKRWRNGFADGRRPRRPCAGPRDS